MEKQIVNENLIKVSGKLAIKKGLELGSDVIIGIKGSVVSTQELDNQDGSSDKVFIVKMVEVKVLDKELE